MCNRKQENRKAVKLLKLIVKRDKRAFTEFYEFYARPVNRFVHNKLKDSVLTEDVTQEFWLYLWDNPTKFIPDNGGDVRAYMFQYLRFRIFDLYRSSLPNMLSIETVHISEIEEVWYSHILESMDEKDLLNCIEKVVSEQPQVKQDVFNYRFRDFSTEEVAKKTGVSKRTVYNYYHEVLTDVCKQIKSMNMDGQGS